MRYVISQYNNAILLTLHMAISNSILLVYSCFPFTLKIKASSKSRNYSYDLRF